MNIDSAQAVRHLQLSRQYHQLCEVRQGKGANRGKVSRKTVTDRAQRSLYHLRAALAALDRAIATD